jgi:SAM-dependent methyltransferase
MSVINLDLVENPVIKAFIREQAKFPEDFKLNICEDDEMYLFALSNVKDDRERALVRYYAIGRRILDTVKQVVAWHFGSFENVPSFLDFACGYGRFTRFLIQEMPPERVWVSDIYANAVKFQTEYLGVSGIVSTGKPENYLIDRKFDCILANSFFSHMPERTFTSWLQNLYNLLTPNGILMFSVHDECLRAPNVEMPAKGILFSPRSESQSLDQEEYGTTYVNEQFVRESCPGS